MAIGDVLTVKINEVVASGDGLGRFGNTAVFATRCCVGETVEVRVFAEKPTWIRAELQKIIGKPSPDRVKPRCEFYGRCGGCTMQHLRYEAQLDTKVARFNDKFRHVAGFHAPEMRVVASSPWEFQNYSRFMMRREVRPGAATGVELGFVTVRGDEFVPVTDCPAADPGIRSLLRDVAETGSLLLPPRTDEYVVYSRGDLFLTDMGTRQGTINLLDRDFTVNVNAFIPRNAAVMERLMADVIDVADTADHGLPMADLYCGIGMLSAFFADSFPAADLMDGNPDAVRLARLNVPGKNTRVLTVKDKQWVHSTPPRAGAYGFMVVDPPSGGNTWGIPLHLMEWILAVGPGLIAYRSQDTGSFARDTRALCGAGYRLTQVTLYDFFPHTGFTDTLAVFAR